MRRKTLPFYVLPALLIFISVNWGCQKTNTTPANLVASAENADLLADTTNLITLELQPGEDGQDTYVTQLNGDSSEAHSNANFNYVHELASIAWTINNLPVTQRSFIKFTRLSSLPANAKIVAAGLLLSGINKSLNHPQGNSVYPGSPYLPQFPDNSCYVQGVKEDWDQTTITWNNQPASFTQDEAIIPSSTSQWKYDVSVDVTRLVRRMVAQQKNYGFRIVQASEVVYRSQQFAVSEDTAPTKRPKLLIRYRLP